MTMDDPFFDIVGDLSFDQNPDDVIDVSKLDILTLTSMLDDLNEKLFEMGQALRPATQEARDMHSLRNAVQVELASRRKS